MSRYIDAEDIEPHEIYEDYGFTMVAYMDDIDAMPTADVVPIRHGRWINSEKSDFNWECSECGYGLTDNKLTYCYDCGALMDLDEV